LDLLDETGLYQSEASLSQVDERREGIVASMARGRDIPVSHAALNQTELALERAMSIRGHAKEQSAKLVALNSNFKHTRLEIRSIDRFLTTLMERRMMPVSGNEDFAQFFINIRGNADVTFTHGKVYSLYIYLMYGDPKIPRSIPAILAAKYWPKQLEEAYMLKRRPVQEEAYSRSLQDRAFMDGLKKVGLRISTVEECLREDLKKYREGEITLIGVLAIK
jgi:hypothetical protein